MSAEAPEVLLEARVHAEDNVYFSGNVVGLLGTVIIRGRENPSSHNNRCYMAHFDNFLLKKLSLLSPLDPTLQCMLTIFTSDSFHGDPYHLASNICKQPDPVVQRQLDELRNILTPNIYGEFDGYRKMTRDFFTDRARSRSHYRDKLKNIELAVMLLKYLAPQRSLSEPGSILDQDCSTIAQNILSRFRREPRLVTFLRINQVRDDLVHRQNLVLAIEAYIKEYDLGITDDAFIWTRVTGTPYPF
ncbi:hypothetical protein BYT27DRAFT_7279794 [Phlegmacium glaucopus]|nr:hypothetical protein BYT27DRAFT_7279794 [Phlegmacium glaucopus]